MVNGHIPGENKYDVVIERRHCRSIHITVFSRTGLGYWQFCWNSDGMGVTAPEEGLSIETVMILRLRTFDNVP